MGSTLDPTLEALWKRVLDDFADDDAHGAFLKYCQLSDQLVEAAVRYRGMAADHARGPTAETKLKAVALLALARLEGARSSGDAQPVRRTASYLLIAFFVLATGGLLAYLASTR